MRPRYEAISGHFRTTNGRFGAWRAEPACPSCSPKPIERKHLRYCWRGVATVFRPRGHSLRRTQWKIIIIAFTHNRSVADLGFLEGGEVTLGTLLSLPFAPLLSFPLSSRPSPPSHRFLSPPLQSYASPPMPSSSLPLEVGPLNPVRILGDRCKLPQRGLGRSSSRNRIWCILAVKYDIWWQQF